MNPSLFVIEVEVPFFTPLDRDFSTEKQSRDKARDQAERCKTAITRLKKAGTIDGERAVIVGAHISHNILYGLLTEEKLFEDYTGKHEYAISTSYNTPRTIPIANWPTSIDITPESMERFINALNEAATAAEVIKNSHFPVRDEQEIKLQRIEKAVATVLHTRLEI